MKALLLVSLTLATSAVHAATSINPANKFSYGANLGWMDWRGDGASGAVIGEFVCSGFIYAANVGWINLGSGAPANGIRYQNNSATDFGVNHDGLGNLSGHAWGANIGWLTFTNRDATGMPFAGPKVDLLTGQFSGFAWSANCGWISLSNLQAFVQTDLLLEGADSDGDGIPDAWELLKFGNLAVANATSDFDGDGVSDKSEYAADTNPLDAASFLRITSVTASSAGTTNAVTWTSEPTRHYRLWQTNDLAGAGAWLDSAFGLIPPDLGATTTRTATNTAAEVRFFRVEVIRPLAP